MCRENEIGGIRDREIEVILISNLQSLILIPNLLSPISIIQKEQRIQ
jgi:hypothetical protein